MTKRNKPSPTSTPAQLLKQLHAHAAAILAEGVVLSSFKHKGLSGIEREGPVRTFLEKHIPGQFYVGQGAIASSDVMLEHQHDIIVADRDLCFMLLNTLNAQLLAIESVHLIVEVRSSGSEMDSLAKSFRAVRGLQPQKGIRQLGNLGSDIDQSAEPVHTVVIYQGPKRPETVIRKLKALNSRQANGKRMFIDFVLVFAAAGQQSPATGYLVGYSRTDQETGTSFPHHLYPHVGQAGMEGPKVIAKGNPAFARWYAGILQHLSGVTVYPPNLYSYLGDKLQFVPWKEKPY